VKLYMGWLAAMGAVALAVQLGPRREHVVERRVARLVAKVSADVAQPTQVVSGTITNSQGTGETVR
jgi:hypothetical protein